MWMPLDDIKAIGRWGSAAVLGYVEEAYRERVRGPAHGRCFIWCANGYNYASEKLVLCCALFEAVSTI